MTTTAINVSHRDGSFAATPEATIEAGLLNGMVEAAKWAMKIQGQSIAWVEITDRFVKGVMNLSGDHVVVSWEGLPFAAQEELDNWVTEPKIEVGTSVVHDSGAAGTVSAIIEGEGIAKVHFPEGIALRPGGPVAAHDWHVKLSTLTRQEVAV
jgi:hypothetical protein